MKVILIGKNGQIGSEIYSLFKLKGISIDGFTSSQLDITNLENILIHDSVFSMADFVINCAAYTLVDKAEEEKEKAFSVNHTGVKNLCIICNKYSLPLIHISTDYVFSGEKQQYSEIDSTNPLSTYGLTKKLAEEEILSSLQKFFILRVSWVFGKNGNNFVKTILKLAKEKEVLSVVADQTGCPTSAKNIAEVIYKICVANNIAYGIYHYTNSGQLTWYEFANKIIEIAKKNTEIKTTHIKAISTSDYKCNAIRPKFSVLSCTKINNTFNIEQTSWEPFLEDVIKEFIEKGG